MDEYKSYKQFAVCLAAVMLVMLVVTGVSIAGEQPKAAAPAPTVGGDYVGSDVCITCHDDQNRRGQHRVLFAGRPDGPLGGELGRRGCRVRLDGGQ